MADNTKIEWTDATWSPIRARRLDTGKVGQHCEKVSPGCLNCYAETFNLRNLPNSGTGLPYTAKSRDQVELFIDEKAFELPLKWKRPRRIFVENQSDLFGEFVPDAMRDRVYAMMALCRRHTFQVLTKRPQNAREYLTKQRMWKVAEHYATMIGACGMGDGLKRWPLDNVWHGVTAENQQYADERIQELLGIASPVRFLSLEPLLGPINLHRFLCVHAHAEHPEQRFGHYCTPNHQLQWVIVGGESGRGARPMDPEWARSIRDQCQAAGVAFHFKQHGEWMPVEPMADGYPTCGSPPTGNRSWPTHDWDDYRYSIKVGKHAAGRVLDGLTWDEFPGGAQ